MSAQPVIDYYLSPVSPWTYLASTRFRELAEKHNAPVNLYIVDLGKVFPVSGGLPLPKRAPQRQAYRLQEMARFSSFLGQPLIAQPEHFPPSSGFAGPVMAAARASLLITDALRATEAIMTQLWAHDEDIGDAVVLAAALNKAGLTATRSLMMPKSILMITPQQLPLILNRLSLPTCLAHRHLLLVVKFFGVRIA